MTFGKQISAGFKGYGKAMNLVFKRGYGKYLLFPLLINIILFVVGFEAVSRMIDSAQNALSSWIGLSDAEFKGANFLASGLSALVGFFSYLMFIILFKYISGFLVMIILSPVFSVLSEKTEKEIIGEIDYPFNLKQFIRDIIRGIGIALRNIVVETLFLILFFGISFIPVIGFFTPFAMYFISAYFFGFSYMDYTNERHGRNLKESVRFMRKHKWVAVTNGALFSLVLMIPFIGVALAAFVAVFSVIAGTVSVLETEQQISIDNK